MTTESESPVAPRLLRRGMNLSILSGALWMFFGSASGGSLLTGALLSLEMSEALIGWVMSLSLIFLPLQIVGAVLQQRYFNRKKFWLICTVSYYGTFFLLALLTASWLRLPHALGVGLFLLTFGLGQCLVQLQAAVGLSWTGDLVPPRESANFWSRKAGVATLAGLIAGLSLGKLADLLGKTDRSTYVVILALGAFFGMLSFFAFLPAVDPRRGDRKQSLSLRQLLGETWRNRNYRLLTAFFGYQSLWAWLSSSFLFVHLQKTMNFSMFSIQLLLAVSGVVGFGAGYLFRIVGARYGRKPILILCSILKTGEFLLWASLIPGGNWLDRAGLTVINRVLELFSCGPIQPEPGLIGALPVFIAGGFVNLGLTSAQSSLLTSTGSKRVQGFAIAMFFAVVGVCGFITSSQSGVLYEYLDTVSWIRPPWTPFNLLATLSALGYLTSVVWLFRFREDGAAPTGLVVREILSGNPFRSVYQAHLLARPLSERSRVETLSRASGKLVANELIRNIYSPSSRVRDSALLSIIKQEESLAPDVIQEIIKLLDQPELGMQAMAARTLGRIRERAAVPGLIRRFRDEDFSVAHAAVFAAGLIAAPEFLPELTALIDDPRRATLHPAAAEALSKIGDCRQLRRVFRVFERQTHWVLRRQCLISAVRLLVRDRSRVYGWFESEELRPGSQLEKRLRNVVEHSAWEGTMRPPAFELMLQEYDAGRLEKCSALILAPLLERCRVFPLRQEHVPWNLLSECFVPGGRMRYGALNAEDPEGTNLWFQLKIWAELKYNLDTPEPQLFFAQLIAAETLLDSMLSGAIVEEILAKS